MNDENENNNPVDTALSVIEETALDYDPSSDTDAPRDVWWWRWLKFMSVIVFPAAVLGLGFMFEYGMDSRHEPVSEARSMSNRDVELNVVNAMKFRFWLGAGVGGGLGLIYVARCIVRKVDP
jgi:hypothetical protein